MLISRLLDVLTENKIAVLYTQPIELELGT